MVGVHNVRDAGAPPLAVVQPAPEPRAYVRTMRDPPSQVASRRDSRDRNGSCGVAPSPARRRVGPLGASAEFSETSDASMRAGNGPATPGGIAARRLSYGVFRPLVSLPPASL